jgi:hypothetical protein
MSRSVHDDALRDLTVRWAKDLEPPAFDVAAIRRRAFQLRKAPQFPHPIVRRAGIAGLVAAVAVLAAVPGVPAIVNNVSRAFHAFVITNGRVQRATTRAVTLDQARTDMPFYVLAPVGLPASLHGTITEVYPSADRADAQLWFRYSGSEPATELTIVETSPLSRYAPPASPVSWHSSGVAGVSSPPRESSEVTIMQSGSGKYTTGGAMITGTPPTRCISVSIYRNGPEIRTSCKPSAGLPPHGRGIADTQCATVNVNGRTQTTCSGSGPSTSRATARGVVTRSGEFAPARWIAHGTLVVLFDASGTLSKKQVEALRAAMSQ